MGKSRTWNGLYYDEKFETGNKAIAEARRAWWKKQGYLSRVVKSFNGAVNVYTVFVSRKKAR